MAKKAQVKASETINEVSKEVVTDEKEYITSNTTVTNEVDYSETMDLGSAKSKLEVSTTRGKGGQLVSSALVEVRKADGSGTEVIRVDDATALQSYGRVQAIVALHEKAGVALCYEFHIVRSNKLFTQFGMKSFSEWVERVTGMSSKTADIYARIGGAFVVSEEVDGKAHYTLSHGLNDYESFLTVGHLLELLKFVPEKGEAVDGADNIPELFRINGFSMYLSTKNMREAIKKILSDTIDVKATEVSESESEEVSESDNTVTVSDNTVSDEEKSEIEKARESFSTAKAVLLSTFESVTKFISETDKSTLENIVKQLADITF